MSIVTPIGRLSFPHIFEPKPPAAGAEPKYSVTLLLDKSNGEVQQFMAELKHKVDAVIADRWQKAESRPKNLRVAIKDGDTVQFTVGENSGSLKKDKYPEFGGHWVISASSKQAPGVVDAECQEVMVAKKAYAGANARISFKLFAYNNVNVGVGCGLNNVMLTGGGGTFGNTPPPPEEDFPGFFHENGGSTSEVQTEDLSSMFG